MERGISLFVFIISSIGKIRRRDKNQDRDKSGLGDNSFIIFHIRGYNNGNGDVQLPSGRKYTGRC
jgi:hypothetical protein